MLYLSNFMPNANQSSNENADLKADAKTLITANVLPQNNAMKLNDDKNKASEKKSDCKAKSADKSVKEVVKPVNKNGGIEKNDAAGKMDDDQQNNNARTNKDYAESPPVIEEEKVQKLGNLDAEIKCKRSKLAAEIENMPSEHEHDKKQPYQAPSNAHVIINDKKCKLYETNNEDTREDDAADDLI